MKPSWIKRNRAGIAVGRKDSSLLSGRIGSCNGYHDGFSKRALRRIVTGYFDSCIYCRGWRRRRYTTGRLLRSGHGDGRIVGCLPMLSHPLQFDFAARCSRRDNIQPIGVPMNYWNVVGGPAMACSIVMPMIGEDWGNPAQAEVVIRYQIAGR